MKSNLRVDILGHLVLPFGTATKADITRIRLVRVDSSGIRLESAVPIVHIQTSKMEALRLAQFMDVFAYDYSETAHLKDHEREGLTFICEEIKRHNPDMTKHEELFINLYFDEVADHHFRGYLADKRARASAYSAFLPIPEMQIYVADPLDDDLGFEPNNNFRVDYGFWNGQQLVAVEIDGAEPSGYARDVRRDRMLRRAGVDVIHILNMELDKYRGLALRQLLPPDFWGAIDAEANDPFDGIPF